MPDPGAFYNHACLPRAFGTNATSAADLELNAAQAMPMLPQSPGHGLRTTCMGEPQQTGACS